MKSFILKVSIFFSLLSIIYLVLSYNGYIRYFMLHFKDTRHLAENYSKKDKYTHYKDNKIVVSLYIDNFKENLKPVINSILDQTVKIDSILIFTPENDIDKAPTYLQISSNIIPSVNNYSYGNNIIPCILKEKDSNVIIIPMDKKIYGEDYIETILEFSHTNPSCQIFNKDNELLLFKVDNFDKNIYSFNKQDYNKKWFMTKSLNKKEIKYTENYKTFN